jgi:2'-5' RNA ligase
MYPVELGYLKTDGEKRLHITVSYLDKYASPLIVKEYIDTLKLPKLKEEKLKVTPTKFKSHKGTEVYVLRLEGDRLNELAKVNEDLKKFQGKRHYRSFKCHVTLNKDQWEMVKNKIKETGKNDFKSLVGKILKPVWNVNYQEIGEIDLKKSEMQKSRGRITLPNFPKVNNRPDQQLKTFTPEQLTNPKYHELETRRKAQSLTSNNPKFKGIILVKKDLKKK